MIVSLIYSFQVFSYFTHNYIYFDYWGYRLISVFHGCNLWVAICLLLAEITTYQDFSASLQVYLLGVPFICVICLLRNDYRAELLLMNVKTHKNQLDAYHQLTYISVLLRQYGNSDQSRFILNGYLEYHRITCDSPTCPSKSRIIKNSLIVQKMHDEMHYCDTLIRLVLTMRANYFICLQKFPYFNPLRIVYVFFLLDIAGDKQRAI